MARRWRILVTVIALALAGGLTARAQTADQAWLGHAGYHGPTDIPIFAKALGSGILEKTAENELYGGIYRLRKASSSLPDGSMDGRIVLGTAKEIQLHFPELKVPDNLEPEGYWLLWFKHNGHPFLAIVGGDERGVLYGAFAVLRTIAEGQDLHFTGLHAQPAMPIRWVDDWDNPDGSIERGYAGRSIFFEGGNVCADLAPVAEYARLLASVGINGVNVNNVNAAPQLLDANHLKQLARIADTMRPWGVRLALSVDIASPQKIGGLSTYDPLDPAVRAWWKAKADEIYALIPDFAGFTVKADSEGQSGPVSYGRFRPWRS